MNYSRSFIVTATFDWIVEWTYMPLEYLPLILLIDIATQYRSFPPIIPTDDG